MTDTPTVAETHTSTVADSDEQGHLKTMTNLLKLKSASVAFAM